jgi:hypothetical protein
MTNLHHHVLGRNTLPTARREFTREKIWWQRSSSLLENAGSDQVESIRHSAVTLAWRIRDKLFAAQKDAAKLAN